MPELRQNIATKEWVIIARERAKRPQDFICQKPDQKIPGYKESCVFCKGNEEKTPVEIYRLGGKDGWKVRVVPNKFPALLPQEKKEWNIEGVIRSVRGVGFHEVIIENPAHDKTVALLSAEEVSDVLNVYRQRYREVSLDPRIVHVIIFKNHGESAGTSLEHPHSQLIGVPVVPHHVRYRVEEAMRYFDDNGQCVFCKMCEDELKAKERIILESKFYLSIIPYAACTPFHTWILPKRHLPSFGDIPDEEVEDLAHVLRDTLLKMYKGLDNPDYNYVIRSVPKGGEGVAYFHWYLTIVPRLTKAAGFELGSGMFINPCVPEENASFLREIKIS